MRKYLKRALAGLFLTMLLLGGVGAYTIVHLQSNARLINYVGIVRGATQRLIKLELHNQPNDEIMQYLNDIVEELNMGNGTYGLPLPNNSNYQDKLKTLTNAWSGLRKTIYTYRDTHANADTLILQSEHYFQKANDTVFSAEDYTSSKLEELMILWCGMLLIMLVVWFFIFWAASKKMLDLESKNKKLSDIAMRDALTGVYLLPYFKEKATAILKNNTENKYALIYTDFSDFKYINDVFGYHSGDAILTKYGIILEESLSKDELCGRVSADCFILLVKYHSREDIVSRQMLADDYIMQYMIREHGNQTISTCCGICCIEDVKETLNIDGYIDRSNLARSTVKSGVNKNYMIYNEDIRQHMIEEKDLENHINEAFEKHQFIVEFQPKVDLKTGKISSAEALVRWASNEHTLIPPDRFIPVFEKKFMINRLDQYVMDFVCNMLREQLDEHKKVVPIAVNVSRLQFYDTNFVERYVAIRNKYQIPVDLIEIEFTESIVFDNLHLLKSIIRDLKAHQFVCAIDDFGKGYSSLSLLKDLPVDYLKIDSYFFQEGEDSYRDYALIEGIINMVHKLHMKTIAEGIESHKQLDILRGFGCDYIQGFIYYRPLSQVAFEQVLKDNL